VLGERKEDAARVLSIKPLTTYTDIEAIEAFKATRWLTTRASWRGRSA
jgi:hypothetical protein